MPTRQGKERSTLMLSHGLTKHPEIAGNVGRIVSIWNAIEYIIAATIFSAVTKTDLLLASKVFYALRNSGARLDITEAAGLHTLKGTEHLQEFRDAIPKIRKALSVRNYYAHCIYAPDDQGRLVAWDPTDFNPEQRTYITEKSVKADLDLVMAAYQETTFLQSRLYGWNIPGLKRNA